MNKTRIRQGLLEIFGPDIGIGVTDPNAGHHELRQIEQEAVARAVPKRVQEFAAGRAAARLALREIGRAEVAIPRAEDRSPVWPAGIAGSISHCDDLCLAVVSHIDHWRALGLDVEDNAPLPKETWPIILTESELSRLTALPIWKRSRTIKALFSIKEAVYKAQYPLTGMIFDFHTLEVSLQGRDFTAELTCDVAQLQRGVQFSGRYFTHGKYLMSGTGIRDR